MKLASLFEMPGHIGEINDTAFISSAVEQSSSGCQNGVNGVEIGDSHAPALLVQSYYLENFSFVFIGLWKMIPGTLPCTKTKHFLWKKLCSGDVNTSILSLDALQNLMGSFSFKM